MHSRVASQTIPVLVPHLPPNPETWPMPIQKNLTHRALLLGLALTLTGCSTVGVEPWQRDILAKPEMALDASPISTAIDDHIYFSKEATSGGRSLKGGGCGCN
jgi:hypothetical protein